ncbi:hypothetical protein Ancab_038679 [Ancistrocladus abbreviatus]
MEVPSLKFWSEVDKKYGSFLEQESDNSSRKSKELDASEMDDGKRILGNSEKRSSKCSGRLEVEESVLADDHESADLIGQPHAWETVAPIENSKRSAGGNRANPNSSSAQIPIRSPEVEAVHAEVDNEDPVKKGPTLDLDCPQGEAHSLSSIPHKSIGWLGHMQLKPLLTPEEIGSIQNHPSPSNLGPNASAPFSKPHNVVLTKNIFHEGQTSKQKRRKKSVSTEESFSKSWQR